MLSFFVIIQAQAWVAEGEKNSGGQAVLKDGKLTDAS